MISARPQGDPDVLGLVLQAVVAFVLGVAVGAGIRALDPVAASWVPLPVAVDDVRALLGAMLSGLVTVTAFALWMRTVMSGLVAGQVSPRVLAGLLDDRYQRGLLAAMAASLGLVGLLLVAVPSGVDVVTVPVSLPVALAVLVLAIAGILVALNRAVRDLSVPGLLTRQVTRGQRLLRRRADLRHEQSEQDIGVPDLPDTVTDVATQRTGWVRRVDRRAMVDGVPDGTQLLLHVRAGKLLTDGDVLVSASTDLDDAARAHLQDAVVLGDHRAPDDEIGHIIEQVVDMATHALSASSEDSATADEAMRAAGILLAGLVRTGEPVRHVADGETHLMDLAALGTREIARTSIELLRMASSTHPRSARQFLHAAGSVVDAARERGRDDIAGDVVEQGRRLLEQVDDADLAAADRDELHRAARDRGLC